MERSIEIPSKLSSINDVRFFSEKLFSDLNIRIEIFNHVFLALSEAVSNSIVHGNLHDDSKKIYIKACLEQNSLVFEVLDEGQGFSLDLIEDPTWVNSLKNEKGRGIFLIRQIADEVMYLEGGRKVRISFKINQ
ncbi:MAG: ATP-binding protein [Bacteroidia bacterium]